MSLIKFNSVTKIYQPHQPVIALDNVSLAIETGELVSIMGPSGSGKSTAMHIIGLLDHPTDGEYRFKDMPVKSFDAARLAKLRNETIGFVFQQFFLLPRLTALQNVSLPLTYREMSDAEVRECATNALTDVGLGDLLDRHPNELSGGQQQRVAIARALVTQPDIILADEPTGALDSQTGDDVMDLLVNLNKQQGKTVIVITHDEEVAKRCGRVIHIKDGRV